MRPSGRACGVTGDPGEARAPGLAAALAPSSLGSSSDLLEEPPLSPVPTLRLDDVAAVVRLPDGLDDETLAVGAELELGVFGDIEQIEDRFFDDNAEIAADDGEALAHGASILPTEQRHEPEHR
jgi:hypothetical protein